MLNSKEFVSFSAKYLEYSCILYCSQKHGVGFRNISSLFFVVEAEGFIFCEAGNELLCIADANFRLQRVMHFDPYCCHFVI